MTYLKFILGPSSLLYMREVLITGNTLARELAECRNLEAGSVFAYLPPEVNLSGIASYAHAHGTLREQSLEYLVLFIRQFLDQSEDRVCLFENRYSRKGDPGPLKRRSRTVHFGEEVYHLVAGKEPSNEVIKTAIVESDTALSLVGVCFSQQDQRRWSSKSNLSLSEIKTVVKNTDYVIVEAFDGGGFLIWSESGHADS